MTNIVSNSKSQLGKLLASENIRIEHRQIRGPYFDVKARVLALPIWKDVSGDLYDLMIGHEVGHALFTPENGWTEKVEEEGLEYKTFLNLVEDARIEKLMKRKYPGLRKPMYNGYTNLVERNFFGVSMDDMKNLPFADRMNVYFKLGIRANVSFNAEEQLLVDRIEACENWDEVMQLAKEVHDLSKKEKENIGDDLSDALDELEDMINNDEMEFGDMDASDMDQDPNSKKVEDIVRELRNKGKTEAAEKLEKMSEKMTQKMKEWSESDKNYSITQQAFDENQETLIDEKSYPITYVTWPKLNVDHWVIPASITHSTMKFSDSLEQRGDSIYKNFMDNNRRYVSYLVKEFELRRNAKQFAKASTSKTGTLDPEKVWKYKLSDDLFLRSTIVPNGKNHGMLMVVDMSSSMHYNMAGTLEQIVNLSMFCRKVNIPFDVYGFTDNGCALEEFREKGIDLSSFVTPVGHLNSRNDTTVGALHIHSHDFRLKQLLHHKMKLNEFNKAVRNLLMLASAFNNGTYSYYGYGEGAPKNMQLSATPLNETIVVLRYVAEKFKKDTQVEVLNTIILTDGDASYNLGVVKGENEVGYLTHRNVIVDPTTRKEIESGRRDMMTLPLLELYKQITGSRVIGFYLMSGKNHKSTIRDMVFRHTRTEFESLEEQYKKEFLAYKYFGMKLEGYDVFYMIPGEELEIENVTMDKVLTSHKNPNQKNTLLKAFKKMQNTKNISRVFLNQFIQQVS